MVTNKTTFRHIGIAGYMGSGKSTVSRILSDAGMALFDADKIAKDLMQHNEKIQQLLTQAYGTTDFINEKTIDFKKLGLLAFSSVTHVKLLNNVVHPSLILQLQKILSACETPLILDAALIPIWNIESWFDVCIWVNAHRDIRKKRILEKRLLSEDQITARMVIQESMLTQPTSKNWHLIDNNGSLKSLHDQVFAIVN